MGKVKKPGAVTVARRRVAERSSDAPSGRQNVTSAPARGAAVAGDRPAPSRGGQRKSEIRTAAAPTVAPRKGAELSAAAPKRESRHATGAAKAGRPAAMVRSKKPATGGRKEERGTTSTTGGRAKGRAATVARRTKSAAPVRSKPQTTRTATSSRKGAAKRGAKGRRGVPTKKGRPPRPVHVPVISYRIKPLDPLQKCGAGTSVQSLYRVDETIDGSRRFHLVFNDRHGWYCEHGRNCPAVSQARKFDATARPGLN